MDVLIKVLSPRTGIRVTYADVTVAAKALEARHLSGPTASAVLGEVLVGAALLSTDLSRPEEVVSLHMHVSGPLKGAFAEASGCGHLRGFTNIKVLNDLDGRDVYGIAPALGESGQARVIKSIPGQILSQSVLLAAPLVPRVLLARYYNETLQTRAGVALAVSVNSGGLRLACGLVAERMPDGDPAAFVTVLEAMEAGVVAERLAAGAKLADIAAILGLPDLVAREERRLQFACRCSRAKVEGLLGSLPDADLEALAARAVAPVISCHVCGEAYTIPTTLPRQLLEARRATGGPGEKPKE